jgi:hypothetical protein
VKRKTGNGGIRTHGSLFQLLASAPTRPEQEAGEVRHHLRQAAEALALAAAVVAVVARAAQVAQAARRPSLVFPARCPAGWE